MKKFKNIGYFAVVLACVILLQTAAMAAELLVPGGMTVGLELQTRGIVVSRLTEVETKNGCVSPAGDAGILPGDCIIKLGGREITNGQEFMDSVSKFDGGEVSVTLLREEKQLQLTVKPAKSKSDVWQLGMWLRDGASGIGTVTYYDPENGNYGALGHGVNDIDSCLLLPIVGGTVSRSVILDIIPGKNGCPGELCGIFDPKAKLGDIQMNTPFGIFGVLAAPPSKGKALETASDGEIKPGKASILSNINGTEVVEYEIEILKVNQHAKDGKSLVIKITDKDLICKTGGIVQGMSGSPILQGGKLVGAVTHVLVSDPARGYGISIDSMLAAAG